MPTERFVCLASGVGIIMALVFIGAHRMPPGWEKVAHLVCFSLITALLWRGTSGQARCAVIGAVIGVAALLALQQALQLTARGALSDFLIDAAAALAAGFVLLVRRKTLCAESSEP